MLEVDRPEKVRNEEIKSLYGTLICIAEEIMRELGAGFEERVYQAALAYELRQGGIRFQREAHIEIFYKGIPIALDRPDFIIRPCETGSIKVSRPYIVELKAVKSVNDSHKVQLRNYITSVAQSSDHELRLCSAGFLINFSEKGNIQHLALIKEV